MPRQDRSHKPRHEADGGAQCGKSARCVRRGGGWKRGGSSVSILAGAPVLDPTWERAGVRFPRATRFPLYRQSQIFARQGIALDRSTLCNWVGRACWWLAPLHELLLSTVLSSPKVFADNTTLPVLDPGNGRTKTGRLWCYAVDNRPCQGPGHPAAAYVYSEDRKADHPVHHLKGFRGLLQVDGYAE